MMISVKQDGDVVEVLVTEAKMEDSNATFIYVANMLERAAEKMRRSV